MRLPLRLLHFSLASLSLLALLFTLLLWHRSHRGPDYIHYISPDQWNLSLISGHGTFDILVIPHWQQDPEFRRGRYDPHVYYGTRMGMRPNPYMDRIAAAAEPDINKHFQKAVDGLVAEIAKV